MSRLAQKTTITGSGSGQHTAQQQKQIQQMLAAGTIQAQEQQVTSLRELLRQEEKRLELLKQMRSTPSTTKPITSVTNVAGNSTKGVIRSTHGIGGLVPSANEVNSTSLCFCFFFLMASISCYEFFYHFFPSQTQIRQYLLVYSNW